MIWALLYLYFFGGASVDLSIMNIAKPVKQYVLDEVKAKEIIAINKAMMSEAAAVEKEIATAKKELVKLNGSRLTPPAEFNAAFAALERKRADARQRILDLRFKMKELMTAAEWNSVYAAIAQN